MREVGWQAGAGVATGAGVEAGGSGGGVETGGSGAGVAAGGSGAGVEAQLARYSDLATGELRRRLQADPGSAHLDGPLLDYPSRAGKGLRPSLCLAACEAFGGRTGDALPTAVAIEALHNAFLVHDDIEDGSELRRGEPTLHRRFGLALALNAGDALALHALGALAENIERLGPRLAERVMVEFDFMSRQTVSGQATELGWCRDNRLDLTPDDYLDLVMKKTCWYTTVLPLRTGALIGSWGTADVEPMIAFGFHLGAAFQIRDDLLNLEAGEGGSDGGYGKEPLGDLREGKRTLMLIHLLAVADAGDRHWLERYLALDAADRSPQGAEHLAAMMRSYGSLGFAAEFAAGVAPIGRAREMDAAFAGVADSPARRWVGALVPFMLERTW